MYVFNISNISSETIVPIEAKFHMKLLWDGGTKVWKVCSNGPGHMTKIAPCPYMMKTLKYLLRNQKTDDLEPWYAALSARVLSSLFK